MLYRYLLIALIFLSSSLSVAIELSQNDNCEGSTVSGKIYGSCTLTAPADPATEHVDIGLMPTPMVKTSRSFVEHSLTIKQEISYGSELDALQSSLKTQFTKFDRGSFQDAGSAILENPFDDAYKTLLPADMQSYASVEDIAFSSIESKYKSKLDVYLSSAGANEGASSTVNPTTGGAIEPTPGPIVAPPKPTSAPTPNPTSEHKPGTTLEPMVDASKDDWYVVNGVTMTGDEFVITAVPMTKTVTLRAAAPTAGPAVGVVGAVAGALAGGLALL